MELRAKNRAKLRVKVRALLKVRTRNQAAVAVVRKVNQITGGWAQAFQYGNRSHVSDKPEAFGAAGCDVIGAGIQLHPRARQFLHRRPRRSAIPAVERAAQSGLDAMNSTKPIRSKGDSVSRGRETRLRGLTRGSAARRATMTRLAQFYFWVKRGFGRRAGLGRDFGANALSEKGRG